jgi:hypothetical protein
MFLDPLLKIVQLQFQGIIREAFMYYKMKKKSTLCQLVLWGNALGMGDSWNWGLPSALPCVAGP